MFNFFQQMLTFFHFFSSFFNETSKNPGVSCVFRLISFGFTVNPFEIAVPTSIAPVLGQMAPVTAVVGLTRASDTQPGFLLLGLRNSYRLDRLSKITGPLIHDIRRPWTRYSFG